MVAKLLCCNLPLPALKLGLLPYHKGSMKGEMKRVALSLKPLDRFHI